MRQRTRHLAAATVFSLIVFVLWNTSQRSLALVSALPDASEIESISAELFDPHHEKTAVPNFVVHSQYYEVILRALRPSERFKYANTIDVDTQALVSLRSRQSRERLDW